MTEPESVTMESFVLAACLFEFMHGDQYHLSSTPVVAWVALHDRALTTLGGFPEIDEDPPRNCATIRPRFP